MGVEKKRKKTGARTCRPPNSKLAVVPEEAKTFVNVVETVGCIGLEIEDCMTPST